ncbi:endonuclease I [Oikeobacillus pervagus]|uniref:Endonuclease I n=1 Tax=Oikeobacillus pervagus TaxID=1325931 RepID=A0AAJ1SZ49_9BACI|nr:endonuclease [Oikeobacillus pervagus]MDQ0213971.1 endonuclease I [Oikeobacillus pervagus]
MKKKKQNQQILLESFDELGEWFGRDIKKPFVLLKGNQKKITENDKIYYDHEKDEVDRKRYYRSVKEQGENGAHLFSIYHNLIKKTHKWHLPYFISKDHYLYTWVDLQPDGSVKSIYSGERKNPKVLIAEDIETIQKRYAEFQRMLDHMKHSSFNLNKKMKHIDVQYKYNTEHVVPQSWFSAREPMKGDLHHLFMCQPECNAARSNFPYADFNYYQPESPKEKIQNRCGVASEGRFEPEYGKGTVARAMLYFFLRYPRAIKKTFRRQVDLELLIRWHMEFDITIYEKHRNRAIYRIQGNRNPFIDDPELATKIKF